MNMKLIVIIAVFLFLTSCQVRTPINESCKSPMIKIGNECCEDRNNNTICDDLEKQQESINKIKEAAIKAPQIETPKIRYINLSELEDGINRTYYPVKKYTFSDPYRHNLTEVEKTFDIRDADRFYIFKMKHEYDYLNTEKNFTDFIHAFYNSSYRKFNLAAHDTIDYKKTTDSEWVGVNYTYEPYLENTSVGGKTAFFEQQLLVYTKNDMIMDRLIWGLSLVMRCTPQLVIGIYPANNFNFYYGYFGSAKAQINYINKISPEVKKSLLEEGRKILKVCNGTVEPYKFKPNEILFDEFGEFTPKELNIEKGKSIIIDNGMTYVDSILLIFLDESNENTFNTGTIPQDTSMEFWINQSGEFTLFSAAFDGKAKIHVD